MRKSTKSSREEEILRDFMRVLKMVRSANAALVQAGDELPLLKEFCKIIVETGDYAFAWVGYAEADDSQRIKPVALWGETNDFLKNLTFTWDDSELGRSPTGAAMRTGEARLCREVHTDPDLEPWREAILARGFTSCLALPLSFPEPPLGVLTIFADEADAFQADDAEALARLAETLTYGVMALRTRARNRELKEELSRKGQMLDFAGEAIFIQDLSGRFLEFNRAAYEALGYSEEELRQLNRFQMEPPEYARLQEERLQTLLDQGETAFESAHFRKDSSILPLNMRSRLLEQDGQKIILSRAQDASQLKQATDALQGCESRLQEMLEQAQLGVFRLRLSNGRLEEANRYMAEIFGYADQAELIKEHSLTKRFVDPGTWQKILAAFKNGNLEKFETRCFRKDGSTVWVLLSGCLSPEPGVIEGMVADISELKRLEEELQKSEEKYRVLVEQQLGRSLLYAMERNRLKQDLARERELADKVIKSSSDGILAFDRNFRLTLWNDGMEAITGFNKTKMLNRNLFGVLPVFKEMHEKARVFNGGPARQILDSANPVRLSPLSPEGYFEGHFFPLRNEGAEVIGGLVVIRNLTELKKAEAVLEEKDRLLANFFDTLKDGAFFLNQDFTILQANPLMEQWFAHEQPLVGKKCYAVLRGRTLPCESCPATQALATGKVHHEVIARKGPEGETLGWLDLSAYPMVDRKSGKIIGLIERASDISEQHLQEEALKEAQERYRRITASIPLVGGRIYADGAIEFFDDTIENLTGYARREFAGRALTWPEVVLEEDRNTRLRGLAQASKEDSSYRVDYRIKTKAGKILWVQESGHITLTSEGNFDHSDIVLFDITDRKQNEEIAPKLEAQLRQAQRMEAIGTLAGGIAHDFNNILGVMLGYAEMALYSLQEDSDLKRKLQQILKAGQRGKDLVSQILAFSRPGKPERKPIKVSSIIKETLKMLRATMPTTVELNLEVEEERDAIQGDPTQIHQVLLNLCANASHAMREKGGILTVSLQPVDLDEATAVLYHDLSPGPYIRIAVKDTGVGMDKEVMERIFDPFFTTKAPGEGTGMGLAVVHSIVKAHGGMITVRSEPEVGTEFQIFLPRINGMPAVGVKERSRMDQGQGNILFVDDEEWLVEMWQEILENMGYKVYSYTVSHEALEAFRAEPQKFDLVITDQTMPHLTGFDMAVEMLGIRPGLPVVLCTGYSEVVTPEKAKAAGIREYVMKPLSISELTGAIRRALGTERAAIKA